MTLHNKRFSGAISLAPPVAPPRPGELLLCGRCESWWHVFDISDDGRLLCCKASSGQFRDSNIIPASTEANAEIPFCTACATAAEVQQGVTFIRPVPSRDQLRQALITALREWKELTLTKNVPSPDQLRQFLTASGDRHEWEELLAYISSGDCARAQIAELERLVKP